MANWTIQFTLDTSDGVSRQEILEYARTKLALAPNPYGDPDHVQVIQLLTRFDFKGSREVIMEGCHE